MSNWPYPRIVAHRGGGWPRKTPWRQSTSAKYGHKMIEFDAKVIEDGEISCSMTTISTHQQRLGVAGELNWQDLLRVDTGSWYSKAFKGEPLPLLSAGGGTLSRTRDDGEYRNQTHHWHWTINGQTVALAARQLWAGMTPPLLSSFEIDALEAHNRRHRNCRVVYCWMSGATTGAN